MGYKIGRKNPERENTINVLWGQGYTIKQIHEKTGIPMSSVGYHAKKLRQRMDLTYIFTRKRPKRATTEPVAPITSKDIRVIFPKKKNNEIRMRLLKECSVEWKSMIDDLLARKRYGEAKDLCELVLLVPKVEKVFKSVLKNTEAVWPGNAYEILTSLFSHYYLKKAK